MPPTGNRRPVCVFFFFLLLAPPLLAGDAPTDDRSTELFVYRCESSLGRREVTLFANGTVRLRDGLAGEEEMYLGELGPEDIDHYVELLGREEPVGPLRRGEIRRGVEGEWVERCEIRLALPAGPAEVYRFGRLDVPPLRVAQLIHLAEELAELARPLDETERLPSGYRPRTGDVLRDAHGLRFRVVGYTTDGKGLELDGEEQPLRIFVAVEDLHDVFVAVEPAGRR